MRNEKIVNVKITRGDLSNLCLLCGVTYNDIGAEKWKLLHDKLKEILLEFDKKEDEKENKRDK